MMESAKGKNQAGRGVGSVRISRKGNQENTHARDI